jgi:structural maintenance of chromosome 4
MKPKAKTEGGEGLLEYLEDIIGSAKYQKDVEELSVKLEETREKRVEDSNKL